MSNNQTKPATERTGGDYTETDETTRPDYGEPSIWY